MSKRACLGGLMTLIASSVLAGLGHAATPWVQALTQEALDSGFLSQLPPNLSVVFGLSKAEAGIDVRQLLAKQGHQIRTFNVSVANHSDVVIFDPPRQGAQAQAQQLAASKVPVVIAVSCNVATFARDARILLDGGYRMETVTPVDQFRHTPHVELVARFSR